MTSAQKSQPGVPLAVAALSRALGIEIPIVDARHKDEIHTYRVACCVDSRQRIIALAFEDRRLCVLEPLANLKDLQYLALERNRIVDVGPLAGLTQLRGLTLFKNRIVDASPLEGLTRLTALNLAVNRIPDVQAAVRLARLPRMKSLVLGLNPLKGVAPKMKSVMNGGGDDAQILAYLRGIP